ncbi:monooxygenase [Chaetomium sp. MPI-CAGE-AT-0009]|nr:monooxygenase [Chaetomium sp. MPI-CAGE-AT-0009]
MKFLQTVALVAASLHAALALPPSTLRRQTCTSPKLRKEWSQATRAEQTSYIQAALCLATKPSRLGLSSTLYDDFARVHDILFSQVHSVPAFLPWHRYFVHVYEEALHECGYTGNAMYWDWVADSQAPASAAVWDPVTGFGGNGNMSSTEWGTQCVLDGPFTGLRPVYWNNAVSPHCLLRMFEPGYPEGGVPEMLGANYSPSVIDSIKMETTFDGFRHNLENFPHGAVHQGVGGFGGDMGPQSSSPNDPMFFLHHAQVDRLWWLWQQQDPQNRTFAYGGLREDGSSASLDDILPMAGFAPQSTVREYMDIGSASLCYTY